MTGHDLMGIWRYQRGTTALAPARPVWGTQGHCECGEPFRSSTAPSKGGREAVEEQYRRHAEEMSAR